MSACNDFAPDSLGEPLVCNGCWHHAADHRGAFALGFIDGWNGRVQPWTLTEGERLDYRAGFKQGVVDRGRVAA